MWNFVKRFTAPSSPEGEREIARVRDGIVYRGPIRSRQAGSASKRDQFISAAATALEVPASQIDLDAVVLQRYGADELQVLECIQAAEDIWGVRIVPESFPVNAMPMVVGGLATLSAMVSVAESKRAAG